MRHSLLPIQHKMSDEGYPFVFRNHRAPRFATPKTMGIASLHPSYVTRTVPRPNSSLSLDGPWMKEESGEGQCILNLILAFYFPRGKTQGD
jgi:hypothetical protein